MSVDEIVSQVLGHYVDGEYLDIKAIEHGFVNQTWLVKTSTNRYVLKRRKSDPLIIELVSAQHALLEHLHTQGFPSPQVVRTRDNASYLNLENAIYELYDYIPGDICDCTRVPNLKAAARTLGQYHNLVSGFKHPFYSRFEPCYTPVRLKRIMDRMISEADHNLTEQASRILERLTAHYQVLWVQLANLATLPHLVIHGDFWSENIIFQGNEVAGVIDYDHARECTRAQEVAEALIYFGRELSPRYQHIVYAGALDLQTTHRFLDAYATVINLTNEEIQAIPNIIRTIWLCASLDPPLKPRLRLDQDQEALLELLSLAEWAQDHAQDLIQIGFEIYKNKEYNMFVR